MPQHRDKPRFIQLNNIGSPQLGYITVLQHPENIHFTVKRVFWTYFTPNHIVRGCHAHLKLKEVLVAVHGSVDVRLENIRGDHLHFKLDNPDKGLYVPPYHWFKLKFSHDAVLLTFANIKYDEKEYIRDYKKFKKLKV